MAIGSVSKNVRAIKIFQKNKKMHLNELQIRINNIVTSNVQLVLIDFSEMFRTLISMLVEFQKDLLKAELWGQHLLASSPTSLET